MSNSQPRLASSVVAIIRLQNNAVSLAHDYLHDGAVVLRGVLSGDEVQSLRSGIDAVLASPSPRAKVASASDDPGFFFEDFCRWRDVPEFETFVRTTRLGDVAAELMGSSSVTLYHDHVLVKEAGTRATTPWHQDQPYYDVEGRSNVSFWIPVDPVPVESSLAVIAGTHRGPWLMPRTFLDKQAKWFPEGSLAEIDDYGDPDHVDSPLLRRWALEPGDAVAFHMLAVHGSAGFPGPGRRRVFSLRVLGDDMAYAPRSWTTSPDFAPILGDGDQRRPGRPLSGEWFPQLVG